MLITFGTNMFYVDGIRHKTCFMLMKFGTKIVDGISPSFMLMESGTKMFYVDGIRHKLVFMLMGSDAIFFYLSGIRHPNGCCCGSKIFNVDGTAAQTFLFYVDGFQQNKNNHHHR